MAQSFENGIDLKKLREMQKDISKKAGDGDNTMLYANKLKEDGQDIRILPALDKMNGVYFQEQFVWWINGKTYLSNKTFGGEDVIDEEVEEARESKDKDVLALVNKKKDSMPIIKREVRYLIPVLCLECEYDDDEQVTDVKVVDGEPKILVAKPTLMKGINRVYSSRQFQNGTKHGMADREKGYNLVVGKTGTGKSTEYYAMGWNEPMEMEEKYYSKIPDVMEMTHKQRKSDEYLRSVIRNYLYGEPVLEDGNNSDEKDTNSEDAEPKTSKSSARPSRAAIQSEAKKQAEEAADDLPTRPKRRVANKQEPEVVAPSKGKSTGGRNLLEDAASQLDDLD